MAEEDAQRTAGQSELDYFIRLANESCNEALGKLEEPLGFISAVDLLYMDFIKRAGGIKSAAAGILLINAHSCFRAAVRLALSGQLLPVFMTLRGSIESALYANAMIVDPALQNVWLERNKDRASRNTCRNAFTINKMLRYLEQAHNQEFAEFVRDVYGATIDFGAHPNSHSLIRSTHIEELDSGDHAVNVTYIHGADSFELRQSLVACAEIGVAVFFVALISFEKHPDMSDLNERALKLQAQVSSFVRSLGLDSSDE